MPRRRAKKARGIFLEHHGSKGTAVVFGGAGFVGRHLSRALVSSGRFERVISADTQIPKNRVDGVEYIACDVREPISLDSQIQVSEIYNLAAVHTTPGHDDWEYFWTNILGAVNVCEFAGQVNCRTLIFTSSISVYGPTEAAIGEEGPFRPDSAYGRSKLQAESILKLWQNAASDRRLVIVRPAVIFGAGENGNFTRLASLLRRGRFFYPGRRDTVKSCGYVGELVRTVDFVRRLNLPAAIYNFAYPVRYTTEDICEAFARVAGFARPQLTMPLKLMLFGGWLFEVLAILGVKTSVNRARVLKLVNSTNVVPTQLQKWGYVFETDLEEGLRRWDTESDGMFI